MTVTTSAHRHERMCATSPVGRVGVDAVLGPGCFCVGPGEPSRGVGAAVGVGEGPVEEFGDEPVGRVVLFEGVAGAVGPCEQEPHAGLGSVGLSGAPERGGGGGDPTADVAVAFEGRDPVVQSGDLVGFESVGVVLGGRGAQCGGSGIGQVRSRAIFGMLLTASCLVRKRRRPTRHTAPTAP